jgi:hypothetical protein
MPFKRASFISDIPERTIVASRKRNPSGKEPPFATVAMEVMGEVEPLALVDPSMLNALDSHATVVHEYSWNLGLTGRTYDWLNRLDEADSLLVQLIFQSYSTPFVFRELFATLEYLPPTRTLRAQPNIMELGKKVISGLGKVAEGVGLGPLGTLSTMVADVIPATDDKGAQWFLNKFHVPLYDGEPAYGLEWHISRRLIEEVGSRLVGRLGVVFIHSPVQNTPRKERDTVFLTARIGLRHQPDDYEGWYDFMMFPAWESGELKLAILPKTGRTG